MAGVITAGVISAGATLLGSANSARASRDKPPWRRSAKKPTADKAATASISSLSSPARQSRVREDQPRVQNRMGKEVGGCVMVGRWSARG